jgi:hypothetical protein
LIGLLFGLLLVAHGEDPPIEVEVEAEETTDPAAVGNGATVEWAERRERYRQHALSIERPRVETSPAPPWVIRQGNGARITPAQLARRFDDTPVIDTLMGEREQARRRTRTLRWLGYGAMLLAPVPYLVFESGTPGEREDRFLSGLFLAGTGAMVVVTTPSISRALVRNQVQPSRYYTREDAEDRIRRHNQDLWQSLDLDQAPAESMDGEEDR